MSEPRLLEALERLRALKRIRDAEGPPPEMTLSGSYRKGYTDALADAIEFMDTLVSRDAADRMGEALG